MAPSDETLHDLATPGESDPAYLYIDEQNILVQHAWQLFGCLAPFVVFWIGALIVGALAGW